MIVMIVCCVYASEYVSERQIGDPGFWSEQPEGDC